MKELRDDVDLWKVGKLNHDKEREAAVDWKQFLCDTEEVLAGKNFIIKKDLEKFRQFTGGLPPPLLREDLR